MVEQVQEAWGKLLEKLATSFDAFVLLLPNLLVSILVAIIGYFTVRYIQRKMRSVLDHQMENRAMSVIMSKVIASFLTIAVLFLILGILNLNQLLTSLLATAGVLGLAIGLALQEPLSNAFSGIMLSIKERFNVGDLIETNGHFGTIKEVNLRSTIMFVLSGQVVSIPNKLVLQNPITNYSYTGKRRVEVDCGISYAENLDEVEQIARAAIDPVSKMDSEPVEFFYTSFGDSSINFKMRFWIDQIGQASFFKAKSDALRAIKAAFDEHDILIPFPIRTLDFAIKGGQTLDQVLAATKSQEQNGADDSI